MSKVSKIFEIANPKNLNKLIRIYKNYGFREATKKTINKVANYVRKLKTSESKIYAEWIKLNSCSQEELERQSECTFKYSPLISIIVPAYNTPINYFKDMIHSVLNQSYTNWELCIADGSNSEKLLEFYKDNFNNESRIHFKKLDTNLGISSNTNKAMKMSSGDYLSFLDHDDILAPNALFEIVASLQNDKYELIYSDEDFATEDLLKFLNPIFKPDWSPYLLRSHNYITHFLTVKKNLVEQIGYFNSKYDGAQDYDFILRCIEKTNNIYHIPKILYHWRMSESSVAKNSNKKLYAYEAGKLALEDHYRRLGINAKVDSMDRLGFYKTTYEIQGHPLVSIIIPNKDNSKMLTDCVESIMSCNIYKDFEIIIVENNSEESLTFKTYEFLKEKYNNLNVITYEGKFNYPKINNFAVTHASGDYFLFLNNDTKMIAPDSILQMLGICCQNDVGVVGSKLLYPDSTIQHAGVVVGFNGAATHVFHSKNSNSDGYMYRPQIVCDYSAVTAACMMVKKSLFNKVNGFSEKYRVAYNDIDLCLKIGNLGKSIVYTPWSIWNHYESKSRGYETSPEKSRRCADEVELLRSEWKEIFSTGDPFYNKNLCLAGEPYKIDLSEEILYSIEYASQRMIDNVPKMTIRGWAVSKLCDSINIDVYKFGSKINADKELRRRIDLYELKIVDDIDYMSGFEVSFTVEPKSNYRLVISDEKYSVDIALNDSFIRRMNPSNNISSCYPEWFLNNKISISELESQKNKKFKISPKISIVVPLYNTPKKLLQELVDSVKNQSYSNWELCLSDGAGDNTNLSKYLAKISSEDKRIKVTNIGKQLRISDNTNEAIKISTGDYISFLDHDDKLAFNALYECVDAINKYPNVELIYTDEDKFDARGRHFMPHFKSDFNIDMLRSTNYICHFCIVKRTLFDKAGWLNSVFDGSQDYDFVLRCIEKTNNIIHIPKILYHWRAHKDSTAENPESKMYAFDAGRNAVQAHYDRLGINANVTDATLNNNRLCGVYWTKYLLNERPLISVVIANKDHVEDLDRCIKSLLENNSYDNIEIIVVENNSCKKTIDHYKELSKLDNVSIIYWNNRGFNYSSINNFGASKARGDYVLFLNNDVEIIKEDSIERMLGYCMRDDVGAVGAKLFYPDGHIQHAGVTIGVRSVAGHNFLDFDPNDPGYFSRAVMAQDLSAVTAACILIKKEVFDKVGGFDESLAVAFNDIDLCLKIRKNNYLIVYEPNAQMIHYESKSRGNDDTLEKYERFKQEKHLFLDRWSSVLEQGDEYYNPNLTLEANDFSLR